MSVCHCTKNKVYINLDRWLTGAHHNPGDNVSSMPLEEYRNYVVLHEVGHVLSQCSPLDHKDATQCRQGKAPIMMQQTRGVSPCTWNTHPLEGVDNIEAEKNHPTPR